MEKMFSTTPAAIREVLASLEVSNFSDEAKAFISGLSDMADNADPCGKFGRDCIKLCDLDSYCAYSLWAGASDVKFIIEEMEISEFYDLVPDKDKEEVIKDICNYIDWSDNAFIDCSRGNRVIYKATKDFLKMYLNERPITILPDSFHAEREQLLFNLYPSMVLMNELRHYISEETFDNLCTKGRHAPCFSVTCDVSTLKFGLVCQYSVGERPHASDRAEVKIALHEELCDMVIKEIMNLCKRSELFFTDFIKAWAFAKELRATNSTATPQ